MLNKEINEKDKELLDVSNSFKDVCNKLEKQITLVELRQQELQNYMSIIDGHITHFDNAANHEAQQNKPDYAKLNKLRAASAKNIEIITDLHNSYKEYETVKFRYFKEISDNNYKKNRLISVDIKRLGTSEEMGTEFYEIMRLLSKLNLKKGDNLNLAASQQVNENEKLLGLVEDGLDEDEYEL
jgi:hypothetical protein